MIQKLSSLCEALHMPAEVTEQVLQIAETLDFTVLAPDLEKLFLPDSWDAALQQLKKQLAPDPQGFKMLTCHLLCALKTRENYRAKGIDDEIFLGTMDCFPRFVGEHLVSYGKYGFDRDFWTPRQLGCIIFRVGRLEYELGDGLVDIHIPSGGNLNRDAITQSLAQGREFIARYYPEWKDLPMVCHSWLLSPTLTMLLPETSGIRVFQSFFRITPTGEEDNSYLEWCYKRMDLATKELPEDTSLQRTLKAHLLAGNPFLDAKGVLL